MPDLGLFDPHSLSFGGSLALQLLRARNPRLPLVAMGAPGQDPDGFDPAALEPFARMDRSAAPAAWPGILGGLLGGPAGPVRKFTAEDLFGDILSDLEGPPAPEPIGFYFAQLWYSEALYPAIFAAAALQAIARTSR